jgi:hypothetical protein
LSTEPQRFMSAHERRRIGLAGKSPTPAVKPPPKPPRRRPSAAALRQARYAEHGIVVPLAACEAELEREVAAITYLTAHAITYRRRHASSS